MVGRDVVHGPLAVEGGSGLKPLDPDVVPYREERGWIGSDEGEPDLSPRLMGGTELHHGLLLELGGGEGGGAVVAEEVVVAARPRHPRIRDGVVPKVVAVGALHHEVRGAGVRGGPGGAVPVVVGDWRR